MHVLAYSLGEFAVSNMMKNTENGQSAVVHSALLSAKVTIRVRNPLIKMEKMLLLYTNHETKKSSLSNFQLKSRALKIYEGM